ncbi:MAG: two-component system response regulator RppA [Microcoleaceae cyanobacterium]
MRLLLVEDEPDLGATLERTLNREKYIVDWVTDGNTAWDYLENPWTTYQLAIFDWMIPGISGLELCRKLRQKKITLPVLILTAKDEMTDKVAGLDAGADDYLVKPFGMAELLARLRALQRRSPDLQASQLTVANLVLDYNSRTFWINQPQGEQIKISLTNKEFQLLEYFMEHPRQVVSSEQVRSQLWAVNAEPVSNVVAAQIRLLRRKLENFGLKNLIETVPGYGYRFLPDKI